MAQLTVPIKVDLPEDWLDQIVERIKQDGDWQLITRCRDCKHFFRDDNGNVVVYRCELNHEDMRDDFFCADGEGREAKNGTD